VESTKINPVETLRQRVEGLRDQLSPTERKVADYMLANPERAATWSASELADTLGTSDATVVRTAQSLGFGGLRELKRMAMSQIERRRDPSLVLNDHLEQIPSSAPGALERVAADTSGLLNRLTSTISSEAWNRSVGYLVQARHVHVFGIGIAGSAAEMLQMDLRRIGVPSTAHTSSGVRLADGLLAIEPSDAVVVFALLRRFREVDTVIRHSQRKGARTILVTEILSESFSSMVDVVLPLPTSTTGAGSSPAVAITLGDALQLAVASERSERALHSLQELNRLREEIVGEPVDVDPILTENAAENQL